MNATQPRLSFTYSLLTTCRILALLSCSVATGLAHAENGVTDTTITIGASAVLSGPLGPQTLEYGQGSNLYFDALNQKGGVNGRKIIYKTLDDGFDVTRTVENTRKLIQEDKVFLIYHSTGTANTAAILPLATENKTIIFGPVTGAALFREKFNRYFFNVRASYANEATAIVKQFTQVGLTKVVVFYQDDGFGNTILSEIKKAAEAQKFELTGFVKLDPKKPDFKAAAAQIEKLAPQAVVMGTAGKTFTDLIKAVYDTPARPAYYGLSVVNSSGLAKALGPQARGIVLSQVMPSLRDPSVSAVAEYLAALKAQSATTNPSSSQFEGFLHAKLLTEGLRKAGHNLTTESLIQAFETSGDISFGKFTARYTPQAHLGSNYVELGILDTDGQLRR
jgi:ABC-type branched-subunit amino acid transport system substrate-binding protein